MFQRVGDYECTVITNIILWRHHCVLISCLTLSKSMIFFWTSAYQHTDWNVFIITSLSYWRKRWRPSIEHFEKTCNLYTLFVLLSYHTNCVSCVLVSVHTIRSVCKHHRHPVCNARLLILSWINVFHWFW